MAFWLIAALIALVVVLVLGKAFLRPGKGAFASSAAYDMRIYRDQLDELDRDLARGTIGTDEAARARVEISRRLLEADKAAQAGAAAGRAPRWATLTAAALSAALLLGGGFWLYFDTGAVTSDYTVYADQPLKARIAAAARVHASRPGQAEAEASLPDEYREPAAAPADYLALVEKLRAAVAERPDDLEGNLLLTTHEARLGNFTAAHVAKARVIALKGDAASAKDYAELAELLVLAAGGYVSPEAEAALNRALEIDPDNGVARYYTGLMYAQIDRPDIGFHIWRDLLEESPADALWVPPILDQIGQLAAMAGVRYETPARAPLAGPTAEDLAAADAMSTEDQGAMIQAMVDQLSTRLATEGGSAQEWAQLIRALTVLDQSDRAAAVWEEARGVFAESPDALAIVRAAAAEAGVEHAGLPDISGADRTPPEAQQETTEQMVSRLAQKLSSQGGTAPEWAQLIEGAASLGETDWANAMWAEAQATFADRPDELAVIAAAAARAGLAE